MRVVSRAIFTATFAILPLVGGCALGADILNPDLFSAFGASGGALIPDPGRVIVATNNETDFAVIAAFSYTDNLDDDARDRIRAVQTAAGEVTSRVLECPVDIVAPGNFRALIGQDGGEGTVAATVLVGDGVNLNYNGSALLSGRDYACGDVIEITILQQTVPGQDGQQQVQFNLRVQIRKGR